MILRLLFTLFFVSLLVSGLSGCDEGCIHDLDTGGSPLDEGSADDPGSVEDEGSLESDEGAVVVDEGSPVDEGGEDDVSAQDTGVDGGSVDLGSVADTGPEPAKTPLSEGVNQLDFVQNVEGEDVDRFVLLHVPQNIDPTKSYPVVFLFHGNGGAAQGGPPKLGALVDQGNFVAVYPDGHLNSWNMGKEASKADDVAFVGMIIDELNTYEQLDTSTLFSMGFSNGAGFSHKLAVETEHFKAIASLTSVLLSGGEPTAETQAISVLQIHGTEDGTCPYNGGPGVAGHVFLAAEESAQVWAEHNGCQTGPVQSETSAGNIHIEYSDCTGGTEVEHYGIVGAGHGLPPNTEGGLMPLVWSFFEQHL